MTSARGVFVCILGCIWIDKNNAKYICNDLVILNAPDNLHMKVRIADSRCIPRTCNKLLTSNVIRIAPKHILLLDRIGSFTLGPRTYVLFELIDLIVNTFSVECNLYSEHRVGGYKIVAFVNEK